MAIVQCKNLHYYDDSKNSECPYCLKMESAGNMDGINEQMTSYMDVDMDDSNEVMTEGYGESVNEYDKTISIFTDETHNELTVGWLVCRKGSEKGKSYVIHSGRNFAGRSADMDIFLSGDQKIEREKHFSIVYDPKSVSFYLVSGNGQAFINGEALVDEILLNEGDIITAGDNDYMFIPFCRKGCVWE